MAYTPDFLLTVGINTSISLEQMRKDIGDLIEDLNKQPQKIKIGLEIDQQAIENFKAEITNIHNSLNNLGTIAITPATQDSSINNTSEQISKITGSMRTAASSAHTMEAAIKSMSADKIEKACLAIEGISTNAVKDVVNSLKEANVVISNVEAKVQNLGKDNERVLGFTIEGSDIDGNSVKRVIEFDKKTQEVKKDVTTINGVITKLGSNTEKQTKKMSNGFAKAKKQVSDYYAVQKKFKKYIDTPNGISLESKEDGNSVYTTENEKLNDTVSYLNLVKEGYDEAENSAKNFSKQEQEAFEAFKKRKELEYKAIKEDSKNSQSMKSKDPLSVLTSSEHTVSTITSKLTDWTAAKYSANIESRKAYDALNKENEALQKAINQQKAGKMSLEDLDAANKKANTTLTETEAVLKKNGDATKSFKDKFVGLAKKFSAWFSASQAIMQAVNALKKMFSVVKEVDTAMTELRKVTNETESTYERFLENAVSRSKTLGATLSDTISATADFARLGYGLSDAEKLSDAAIVYKNVGDGIDDINTASESIIATMQAFGIAADDVMNIVDKFNSVGNNYAISSKGVGDALLRSAAAMHAANNSLDQTIALAAAANTIIQDPEKVGTTLKTISMFLRASKEEAEEAGESTEGMANSVSELRQSLLSLTGGVVDIQIDDKTFKDTYTIIKELSQVWGQLDDITQANITELIGGKRNSNVASALLENFSVAEKALETSATASGSALAENEKYLDSIQGRLTLLKTEFENLSTSLIDSEIVKTFIDLGTGVLKFLDGGIDTVGSIGAIISAVAGVSGLFKGGLLNFDVKKKELSVLGNVIGKVDKNTKKAGLSFDFATLKMKGMQLATNLLVSSLTTLALSLVSMAMTYFIENVIKAEEKAREAAEKQAEEIKEMAAAYKEATNSIHESIDVFVELRSKTALTNDEKDRLLSIQESLIETFGIEAKGIDLVNGKYDEQLEKLKEISLSKGEQWHYNAHSTRVTAEDKTVDNKENNILTFRELEDEDGNVVLSSTWLGDTNYVIDERIPENAKNVITNIKNILRSLEGFEYEYNLIYEHDKMGDYGYRNELVLSNTSSQQKVKNITAALEALKNGTNFEEKNTDLYKDVSDRLVALLNHYQEEIDNLDSALSEEAEAYISSFQSSDGTTMHDVAQGTYFSWRKELISSIDEEDQELRDAVKGKLSELFSFDPANETYSSASIHNSLSNFKEQTLSNVTASVDKINSSINLLAEGSAIPRDTMLELLEIDSSLADSFTFTTNGYTADIQRLVASKQELINTNKKLIESEIATAEKALSEAENQVRVYRNNVNTIKAAQQAYNDAGFGKQAEKYNSSLEEAESLYQNSVTEAEEIEETLQQWILLLDIFNKGLNSSFDPVNDYLEYQQDKIEDIVDNLEEEKEAQEDILDNLESQKEELEEQKQLIEDIIADYETAASTVTTVLEDKIQELTDQNDELQKAYDDQITSVEERYNTEIEALQEKNDEINRSIELKKKEDELYNAKRTRVRVYSESGGWTEQTDSQAVKEKTQELQSLQRQYAIEDLENQRDKEIKALEDRKENDPRLKKYAEEIEAYEKYMEAFEKMVESYEREQNDLTTARVLGVNWHEQVLNRDTGLIQTYGQNYTSYQKQLYEDIEKEIEAKDLAIAKQQEVIDSRNIEIEHWNDFKTDLQNVVDNISDTNEDYFLGLDNVLVNEKMSYQDRLRALAQFKKDVARLNELGSDPTMEQVEGALGHLQTIDGSKIEDSNYNTGSANKYAVEYRNAYGNKVVVGYASSVDGANAVREHWISRKSELSGDDELFKELGFKGVNSNTPPYILKQLLNSRVKIAKYAEGGSIDYTGLAMVHGSQQRAETTFNARDSKKLYELVHKTSDLSALIANNINSNLLKAFNNIKTIKAVKPDTNLAFNFYGATIQADNYESFERCMNTYLSQARMNNWVGK